MKFSKAVYFELCKKKLKPPKRKLKAYKRHNRQDMAEMVRTRPNFNNCYFSRHEIEHNSPSRKDGIDLKTEKQMRYSYCKYLQEVGMKLKLSPLTIATAIVFCHRFYLHKSLAKYDPKFIATSCLYLASKAQGTATHLHDLINVSYKVCHKTDLSAREKIRKKHVFRSQKQLLIKGENVLLGSVGFDFNVHLPYKPLLELLKKLNHKLCQVAWNFVNDSLITCLCLQYKAHQIAAAAIILAACSNYEKLPSWWWQQIDASPQDLEDIHAQMLELYDGKGGIFVEEPCFLNTQDSFYENDRSGKEDVTLGRRKRISKLPEVSIINSNYNQVSAHVKVPIPGSRQPKKSKTTNEEFNFESVSEDLSKYTVHAEILCKQVEQLSKEHDLGDISGNSNPKLDNQGDFHMIPHSEGGVVEVVKYNQIEPSKTFVGTMEKGDILQSNTGTLEKVVEYMEKKLIVSHNGQLSLKRVEMETNNDGKDEFSVLREATKCSQDDPIVILNCDTHKLPEKKTEGLEKPTACIDLDVGNDSRIKFPWERNMQDESDGEDNDGLSSLWKEMSLALRCSQVSLTQDMDATSDNDDTQECMHSFIEQDDLGKVCILCGFIGQTIDTMFDIQWPKARKATKHNWHAPKDMESIVGIDNSQTADCMASQQRSPVVKLVLHPLYRKHMKSHQFVGFEFLQKNLITEDPGGCILAHAPGTGKSFLVISFIQSFLTKYPDERPLIVAPKSVLCSWMNEFKKWQVEEIPLLDLYEATNKAESLRSKQLQTLREWKEKKSILLVSYAQFSNIICEKAVNQMTAWCQKLLLEGPGLLILDEGHFPRNKDTNILYALSQIHTRRRILLSGTLFQNNIKELFNLLRLIRPDILELDSFQAILTRLIQNISGSEMYQKLLYRRHSQDPLERIFCKVLDYALQSSEEVKMSALHDLQELTSLFVHYYKGEILEDLPGLVDFTVKLSLNEKQKGALSKAQSIGNRMSRDIMSAAVAIHPSLDGEAISGWLDSENNNTGNTFTSIRADSKDGVKTKFVLDILSLCESTKEKLLVFSQYLPPLSLLENMLMTEKKWSKSHEILRLDGSTPAEVRGKIIEQFNTGPDSKVLFASIKACGEGICLTGASRVIILDIPWNPSITRQAISRAYRIGQKRKVYAYRLVAVGTPEEDIQRASLKKELMSKILFEGSNQPEDPISLLIETNQDDCEDMFFQSGSPLRENLNILYKQILV